MLNLLAKNLSFARDSISEICFLRFLSFRRNFWGFYTMMFFMDFDLPHPNDLHLRFLLMQRTCRFLKVAPIRGVSQDSGEKGYVQHPQWYRAFLLPLSLRQIGRQPGDSMAQNSLCFPPMKFDLWIYSPVANELLFICFVFVSLKYPLTSCPLLR